MIIGSTSKSTDKLALLVQALESIPKEILLKVKSFELCWEEHIDGVVCPKIKVEFKPEITICEICNSSKG